MPSKRFITFGPADADSDAIPLAEPVFAMTSTKDPDEQVEQLFEALRVPVYRYLLSVFGDAAEAEDLTQDSFFKLHNALLQGQEIENIRFWIFRVAHNLAVNQRKHQQFVSSLRYQSWDEVERVLPDTALNPEQATLRREKFARLFEGIKRLTLNERQCLYLRAEGFRYREIAEIMGVGVPTVGEYLRRSILKLGAQSVE